MAQDDQTSSDSTPQQDHPETGSEAAETSPVPPEEPQEPLKELKLSIELEYDDVVNFALQQNDVPIVKRIIVENLAESLGELTLRISPQTKAIHSKSLVVGELKTNDTLRLDSFPLQSDAEYLKKLVEREKTQLDISVEVPGYETFVESFPLVLFARNEWPGTKLLPEILSAFVFPNSRSINKVLSSSLRLHEARTSSPTFDGYQSQDPTQAIEQMRSLWDGLAAEDLGYVGAPASFELQGQKVRFPETVLEDRLGNCLDLSLFAAGLLEQCGFFPVIVLLKDHAFCGAWTTSHCFAEPSVDDLATLRKRVDIEDIVIFETTMLTKRPLVPFHAARSEARKHLEKSDNFVTVIDVQASRKLMITPMGLDADTLPRAEVGDSTTTRLTEEDLAALEDESPFDTIRITHGEQESIAKEHPESLDRMSRWQRRLLDLSLRNRLLNYKETKKNISLLVPQLDALENALEDGLTFSLAARPQGDGKRAVRDAETQEQRTGLDPVEALLLEDLKDRIVHADVTDSDLEHRLLALYRASRSALEETGSNTLYLALGFLRWFETDESNLERRAPIILVPMQLTRKSASDGFRIRRSDDDLRINTTLLEKLKQDYAIETQGLEIIEESENGTDVDQILNKFRRAIVDIPRWDIMNESALGLFSFNKFLMWVDLAEQSDRLKSNPVVNHLVEHPGEAFDPEAMFPEAVELDSMLSPQENLCPLDADSSQLRAVVAATAGRTFVLQGPPGTGKSQTITNLIAQSLAMGKRVLFVAEKMAALNVVHARLSKIGLEDACLELHSNKSSKRHVLEQLGQALDNAGNHEPEDWQALAQELAERRDQLNAYVQEIHARHAPGLSIYSATARLAARRDTPVVKLEIGKPASIQRSDLDDIHEAVDALATAAGDVSPVADHGLFALRVTDWTPKLESRLEESIESVRAAGLKLRAARMDLAESLGLPAAAEQDSNRQLSQLARLLTLIGDNPGVSRPLLTESPWSSIRSTLSGAITRGRELESLREGVEQSYADELLSTDANTWLQSLQKARSSFPPLSWIRTFLVRRALKPFAKQPLPDTDTLLLDLGRIEKIRAEKRHFNEVSDQERAFFGHHWRGSESDWDLLDRVVMWVDEFREIVSELSQDSEWVAAGFRERALALAVEESDLLLGDNPLTEKISAFIDCQTQLELRLQGLDDMASLDRQAAFGTSTRGGYLERLDGVMNGQAKSLRDLRLWCHWNRVAEASKERGLHPIVSGIVSGTLAAEDAREVFEKSFLEEWLTTKLEESELLLQFNSREHERKIQAFARLDERLIQMNAQVIQARIAANLPAVSKEASSKSEVGILQRQLKLKRRPMPIRKLFESLPELLPRLKPCLLMSPLSVAQYLTTDYPAADIVVFDEASQIPVWDAIGALARGKSAVIVGDSKQLPPTTFFRSQDDDADDFDGDLVEEVESILDECEAGGLPSIDLAWHYRSRHEDLIAFSNHHYYRNRLMTFPSPTTGDDALGIELVKIKDGVYDRSNHRTNVKEAEAVVAEIIRRLESQTAQKERQSIGVVAFSQAQQVCIEDLLEAKRRENPDLERHFQEGIDEPVFVKNLENVQGDERDIILFSICYGPDDQGRVSMNFGPLNREGGERRLNVAITRARRKLMVFSTLRSESIDLSRSRATGVAHLKSFLEYAQRGPDALPFSPNAMNQDDKNRPLVESVGAALEARGHAVKVGVGSSLQPIDIAICDPDDDERYLLAIECDGNNYRMASCARDRDRLRTSVLEGLGWKIARVWSQDWLQDEERELDRIENILKGIEEEPEPEELGAETQVIQSQTLESLSTPPSEEASEEDGDGEALELKLVDEVVIYRAHNLEPIESTDETPALFNPNLKESWINAIREVLSHEAPISHQLLSRRLMAASNIERLTAKVREQVAALVAELPTDEKPELFDDVYFLPGTHPDTYSTFRTAALGEVPRQAEDIHPVEIANAAVRVLREQIALPKSELPKEVARMLGFPRLGSRVKKSMEQGIDAMLERGLAMDDGERVRLPRGFPPQDNR